MTLDKISNSCHGGDIYSLKNEKDILDFSINVSPLGFPCSVKTAIINSDFDFEKYPDINQRKLRSALSEEYNLQDNMFFIGNGAAEVIFSLVRGKNIKSALVLAPSFSEYEKAVFANGGSVSYYYLNEENSFLLSEDILSHITYDIDAVFICNPNNPTGSLTDENLLKKILEKCLKTKTLLVIDECFLDFTGLQEKLSFLKYINSYDNLFIIKAFTKIYSMAGLRLGFGISSNEALLKKMRAVTPPWNVSTIAQIAGAAALKDRQYKKDTVSLITKNRPTLKSALESLGLKVFDSRANFLLFKYKGNKDLKKELISKNILIRDCENYSGLKPKAGEHFYRVAVKTDAQNERLISNLKEVILE